MRKPEIYFILIFLTLLTLLPLPLSAQLLLGQYQDEAPLRTWNNFGYVTAAQTAMGGTRYAHTLDLTAGQSNPSLLSRLPKLSAVLSGSFQRSEMYTYGPVNTGVLFSESNLGINSTILDFGGIAVNINGWGLAFSVSINELFERPASGAAEEQNGEVYYSYRFIQDGYVRTYNLALSRKITPWLAVGMSLGIEDGWAEKSHLEEINYSGVTISSATAQEFRGYTFQGGLTFDFTDKLTLATVFRGPYTRQADGTSQISNSTPPATDIRLGAEGKSEFKQPLVLGLGIEYAVTQDLRLVADTSYYNWATYAVDFFGVPLDRDFRNVLTLHAGAEYQVNFHFSGQEFKLPLRLGLALDPQPVTSPAVSYSYVTCGFGLSHRYFHLDAGYVMGWESGSSHDLKVFRAVITLGFRL